LPEGRSPSWPRYFLLCHAIELALKAYLVRHGHITAKLKSGAFGHKLDKLLTKAVDLGLPLGVSARGEIELLNEAHAENWPRYPKEESKPVFVIEQFEPHAVELLRAVAISLRGKSYRLFVNY
jgi:hypothetical protein